MDDFVDWIVQGGCGISFNFEQFNSTTNATQTVMSVPISNGANQYVGAVRAESAAADYSANIWTILGAAIVGTTLVL